MLMQHLIAQNSWANDRLRPFATKSIQFNVGFISTSLVILGNGGLAIAGETNIADAIITISSSLALRLMTRDEAAKLQLVIKGDSHLVTVLAKVLANTRWDYEDDLGKLVGDIPAKKIGEFSRHATHSVKESSINLAETLREYWQEENPLIAKKCHADQFNVQVDALLADAARFEKKLAKFTQTPNKNFDLSNTAVEGTV